MADRILGITVLSDFILSEGVEPIVENLKKVGATAVVCNPTVTAPADEGTGSFQPPDDAGSSPRFFDRELFGKRALWVKSGPSYVPNSSFYIHSLYPPRKVNDLTHEHGPIIGRFIEAAASAGLKVYLQLGAVQPSGLRDEDRPLQPDGTIAMVRMADTGSLASLAIRAYNRAYVQDLLATYPTIDGFRIDWPEYPCYTMGETLHDFGIHVKNWAKQHDFAFDRIHKGIRTLYDKMHGGLSNDDLVASSKGGIENGLAALIPEGASVVGEWLNLKAALSVDLVADWQQILIDAGRSDLHLTAHAFMPPYSTVTGLDFAHIGKHCNAVSPKFYTMHWPLMVEFWTNWLMERNPHLDRTHVVRTIATWMELGSQDEIEERLDRYYYPAPDEEHPIPIGTQQHKLQQVREQLRGAPASLIPLVHGYGPIDDFARRFETIAKADVDGVWINRYGYLSDEKLDTIARIWQD